MNVRQADIVSQSGGAIQNPKKQQLYILNQFCSYNTATTPADKIIHLYTLHSHSCEGHISFRAVFKQSVFSKEESNDSQSQHLAICNRIPLFETGGFLEVCNFARTFFKPETCKHFVEHGSLDRNGLWHHRITAFSSQNKNKMNTHTLDTHKSRSAFPVN